MEQEKVDISFINGETEHVGKALPGVEYSRTVLVTRFDALSDVITTIPVLYDACRCNPDVRVVMLTRSSMAALFIERPDNLEIRGEESDVFDDALSVLRQVRQLHAEFQFDSFVDLQGIFKTSLARFWCKSHGLKVSMIDHGRKEKRELTRKHGKLMLPVKHTVERYREAMAAVGLEMRRVFKGLFYGATSLTNIYNEITAPRQEDAIWIGLAPFAKHEGKIYPLRLTEQVLRELSGRSKTTVFLFGGGPYEQKILGEWARKYPSTISLAGKRNGFAVELALIHDLDILVTMDSANMHMASLVGTPVVTLWGATHPYCGYSGWNVPDENNVQLPMPCRPCSLYGDRPCLTGDYRCLARIKPEVVTARVDVVLKSNSFNN